jgi:hypothetical protein
MKVTMMLADSAQAVDGKLYILGGGWSVTGPDPAPSALAIKIEVPWVEANIQHQLVISLLDADEQPVRIGDQVVELKGGFEVGRPPGVPVGTPLDATLAISIGPIPLERGKRYIWRLAIDGNSREDWSVAFNTRTQPPQQGMIVR